MENGSVNIKRLATVVTMMAVVYFGQSGGIGKARARSRKASPAPDMKVRRLAWREATDVLVIRLAANMVDVRVKRSDASAPRQIFHVTPSMIDRRSNFGIADGREK